MTQVYAGSPTQGQSRPGLRRQRPRRRGASRAGAARGPAGPARPSSPPPPPSRRIPGRSRPVPGPSRPGRSAAAAQFGPVPPGARLARPGICLRRRRRRRGALQAGAARGPAGPAFVVAIVAAPAVAAHPGPEASGAWPARPGFRLRCPCRRGAPRAGAALDPGPGLVRPGLWSLILRCVIRCASESSVRRGPAPGRFYLSSCAFTHWTWVGR
jgi:hypothetical protein